MKRNRGFPLPPKAHTAEGMPRRLGVELEFSGMDVETAADIVQSELGGSVQIVSNYERCVRDTDLGDFNVELDFAYLKSVGRAENEDGSESLLDNIPESLVAEIAAHLVPIEVVSAPVVMEELGGLHSVVDKLREGGARGTRQSPLYAFGLHLNPEMPALDSTTVRAYLAAFLCLYEWLLQVSEVDWSRRMTPYIDPCPTEYVQRVVAPDYAPSLAELLDDYLQWNADRNRALDMLPLFAHLDEARVRAAIDDPRIKARPALHYRLANCDIDRSGWGIEVAWRDWLQVEHLAEDSERLADIGQAYVEHLSGFASRALGDWPTRCRKWLLTDDR